MEELREVAVHMRTFGVVPISEKGVVPDATCGLRRCLRTADSGHGEFELFKFGTFEGVEVGMSMKDRYLVDYSQFAGASLQLG